MKISGSIKRLYHYEPADSYKWVVLITASISQFCTLGIVIGTTLSLYASYEEMYGERKISSIIGTIQITLSQMAGILGSILMTKIGVRNIQFIGGLMMAAGFLFTGYTTQAWQGCISSGLIVGSGAGLMVCSTFSIVSQYFHTRPEPALAFIQISVSIGGAIMPIVIGHLQKTMSFLHMFIVLAGISFVNCVLAIFFFPKSQTKSVKSEKTSDSTSNQHFTIKGKKRGIYYLPTIEECTQTVKKYRTFDSSSSDNSLSTSSDSFQSGSETSSADIPSFVILNSENERESENVKSSSHINEQSGIGAPKLLELPSLGSKIGSAVCSVTSALMTRSTGVQQLPMIIYMLH